MKYDGAILEKHAGKLLDKASNIEAGYTFFGAILGLMSCAFIYSYLYNNNGLFLGVLSTAAIIALFYWYGQIKAFSYRVQAHTSLALIQIEINTRKEVL
jgi:hypothetical protein